MRKQPLFRFLVLAASQTAFAADWTPRAFPPGPDREIRALRVADGALYAGGAFGVFGSIAHTGVMRWDGKEWAPLGSGLKGTVQGLAIDGRGFIYASGNFTRPDGAYGLGVWDGKEWVFPSGAKGLSGWGPITTVGDAAYMVFESQPKEIYRCDGNALVSLEAEADGFILTLEGRGSDLIAGGEFTAIGGIAARHVASFGTGWEKMAEGVPMTVRCLAVLDGVLFAGGGIGPGSGRDIPGLARWDGGKWTDFESLPSATGYIDVLAEGSGRIYAGGFLFPAERDSSYHVASLVEWDGSDWKRLGNRVLNNDIRALAVLDGTVWAGGRFQHPSAPYLSQWNGKNWSPPYPSASQAPSGPISVFSSRDGRMLAAGTFKAGSPDSVSILAEWAGDGWAERGSAFPAGGGPISIFALEQHGGDVYLCASFSANALPGLWRLTGGEWKEIGKDLGIKVLRSGPDGLYAGGHFTRLGSVEAKHVARWDGVAWHAVGAGLDYPVSALEWDGTALYAAEENWGTLSGIPSQISRFHGGQWTVLGATASAPLFNGTIRALVANDGELWAAGEFQGLGLFKAKGVAVWNGSAWRGIGEGLAGVLSLTASPEGKVYAAGKFAEPSGGVAHWNGSAWEALGKGLSVSDAFNPPAGKAVACLGEDLFVAGFFDFAGGKPSAGFARWTRQVEHLGIRAVEGRARVRSPVWRLFPDGRLLFADPAFAGGGFDALGRKGISLPAQRKLPQ